MRVKFAVSVLARLKGLLFSAPDEEAEATLLVLAPCASVHTFGMRYPIDIAFVDAHGVVLTSYERVQPGRLLSCRDAALTLERFSSSEASRLEPWFKKGNVLHFDN